MTSFLFLKIFALFMQIFSKTETIFIYAIYLPIYTFDSKKDMQVFNQLMTN